MVIPLPGGPGARSINSLPDEARPLLRWLKFFVIGQWVFGGLFFFCRPVQAATTLMLATFGTFLLSEDPHLAGCHRCLKQSPIGQCCTQDGLAVIMPFLVFSGVNGLMDSVMVISIISRDGAAAFGVCRAVLCGVAISEVGAAVLAGKVLNYVFPATPGSDFGYVPLRDGPPLPPGQAQGFAAAPGAPPPGAAGAPRAPPGATGPAARGPVHDDIRPFTGPGFKLGA